jgi:hypothetical protein
VSPAPRHVSLPRRSENSSTGLSIPTILGRRASLAGTLAFVSLLAASFLREPAPLVAEGSAAAGVLLGFVAFFYLIAAFVRRREDILVRHLQESLTLAGSTDLETLSQETGVPASRLQALLNKAIDERRLQARLLADGSIVEHGWAEGEGAPEA